MLEATSPFDLLRIQARTLIDAWPAVREGQIDAIHDARVGSRRIRELLPLADRWYERTVVDDFGAILPRIGKSLGRVRDDDVRMALIAHFECRIPPAAPSLVVLRRRRGDERLRLMRKLIKRFERLDVTRVLCEMTARRRGMTRWTNIGAPWRDDLRRTIADRARTARESIDHATGVYFPNRLHSARIAIKKFRYALEIAAATSVGPSADESLRDLKKTQEVLGDLHDRQVLIDDLAEMSHEQGMEIDLDHVDLVVQVVEAECRDLHARYLTRRARVLQTCAAFERTSASRTASVVAAAAALAVPSAVYLLRRAQIPARPSPIDRGVSIRIPIPDTPASV